MGTLIQDLRYGARMLWRSPSFTIVAVLALAIGIGATTAIYTVVDAVMLRPLPFAQSSQLTVVTSLLRGNKGSSSYLDFADFRDRNHVFSSLAAYTGGAAVITGGADPRHAETIMATPSLFRVLAVPMRLGRGFSDEEARPNSHVVVISHALWQSRFNRDPDVVGKTLSLDTEPNVIVGVLPEKFQFPIQSGEPSLELVLPYPRDTGDAEQMKNRGSHGLRLVGRLKPGVTAAQARADMDSVVAGMKVDHPGLNGDETLSVRVEPLREEVIAESRPALMMWLVAVLCVLLIACANVAGLLLARASARQREIAVRVALGAGRGRIVRQMLTESVLLGIVGGGLGILLALWLVDLLVALVAPALPRIHDVAVDGRVLLVTFALAVLTGVLFGLWPALHASRADLNDALKETGRSTAHARSRRARNALIVGEIAGALLLLVGAGLTLRSFARLTKANPGFDADRLAVAQLDLPNNRYPDEKADARYYRQLEQAVALVPGADAAAVAGPLPFSKSDWAIGINLPGQLPNPAIPHARYVSASPRYFEVMGIPLLRGRTFNANEDTLDGPPALVIDQTFAHRMWPGADPIGKRLRVGISVGDKHGGPDYEIIGVVGDVHSDDLDKATPPTMYTAYGHIPIGLVGVVVRSKRPQTMEPALRAAILSIDKDLPPPLIGTMSEMLQGTLQAQKALMVLLSLFAGVALILATIGVYGVMSYTVTQRTREIGIRVALGAGSGEILTLVLGESLRLSLAAIVLGVGAALLGGRALESQLYGVAATDLPTLVAVVLIILTVCMVASFIPARRATKVDPMVALRYE